MNYLFVLPTLILVVLLVKYVQPWAHKKSLAYATLLMILGFLLSELIVYLGFDTGLRWNSFNNIVNYFVLPIMVYDIAFRLSARDFIKRILTIVVLAIPFYIVSVFIVAYVLFVSINHPGFPFIAAIITAAMLSTASLNTFRRDEETKNGVISILKGEGIFNSVVLIVFVTITLDLVGSDLLIDSFSPFAAYVLFVKLFSGGVFIGFLGGSLGWYLLSKTDNHTFSAIVSTTIAFATFLISSVYFEVSGIVAILVAGLMLNAQSQSKSDSSHQFLCGFWSLSSNLTRTLLYLLLGVSIYLPFLQDQWLAITYGVGATLFSRAILIYFGFSILSKHSKHFIFPPLEKFALYLGSVKGAAVIALVLSLPEDLPYSQTIQSIVYGMVIFSLLVQAPILKMLLPKIAITK